MYGPVALLCVFFSLRKGCAFSSASFFSDLTRMHSCSPLVPSKSDGYCILSSKRSIYRSGLPLCSNKASRDFFLNGSLNMCPVAKTTSARKVYILFGMVHHQVFPIVECFDSYVFCLFFANYVNNALSHSPILQFTEDIKAIWQKSLTFDYDKLQRNEYPR